MNRRQKKKAYKKKYGHNPPKTEAQYHRKEWNGTVSRIINEIMEETISGIVPFIMKAINSMTTIVAEAIENIKTMPEEDFNRLLESSDLDGSAKVLAIQIRRTGQNGSYAKNIKTGDERGNGTPGTGDYSEIYDNRADNSDRL